MLAFINILNLRQLQMPSVFHAEVLPHRHCRLWKAFLSRCWHVCDTKFTVGRLLYEQGHKGDRLGACSKGEADGERNGILSSRDLQ